MAKQFMQSSENRDYRLGTRGEIKLLLEHID